MNEKKCYIKCVMIFWVHSIDKSCGIGAWYCNKVNL